MEYLLQKMEGGSNQWSHLYFFLQDQKQYGHETWQEAQANGVVVLPNNDL